MRRFALFVPLAAGACSLITSLDGLGGGDAGDATADAVVDGPPACQASTLTDPHNCGACGHDCCGGGCDQGHCTPLVLATQQLNPQWLVADATHVYWELNPTGTDFKFPAAPTDVMRVGIDGKGLEVFAHDRQVLHGIQSDGTRVIWMEATVSSMPFLRVAWVDKTADVGDAGQGATVQYAAATDPDASFANTRGFLVTDTQMYWFASSATECPGIGACVFTAPTTNPGAYTVVHTSFSPYNVGADSFDNDFFYPWSGANNIYRVAKTLVDGGLASDFVVATAGVSVTAVDDTMLYWSETNAGTVYALPKVPTADAGPTAFATLQNKPTSLFTSNGAVYWANADGIVSCPASGCPEGPDKPRVVVAETGINSFTATSSCFFYVNAQSGSVKVIGR